MKNKKGFTLIELMVTISITLLVITMVGTVFVQGYTILNRTDNKSAIQDEVRNAIMRIESEASKTNKIKVRNSDSINRYNNKEAKELLYLEKIDERVVYLEVVEDSTNNINQLIEVKLNNDESFKEEKILLSTIQGDSVNKFSLTSTIEGKIININFNRIIKGNQISGENYIVTLNTEELKDIELDFGGDSKPVVPETPEGGIESGETTDETDKEEEFVDILGKHYLTISGVMNFQSESTHVEVKGNGNLAYGSSSGDKEHFEVGADNVIQNNIESLVLNNLERKDLVITPTWNIENHDTYVEYNGFKIVFVNGNVKIGEENDDNITLKNTIIIATGEINFEKNNIELRMEDSLLYGNSIMFHNKSIINFANTLTSSEIINRTKEKLRSMMDKYKQVLDVNFSIVNEWSGGADFKIILNNNSNKKIVKWEIEFNSDKNFTACWNDNLYNLGDGRYKISNGQYDRSINQNSALEIKGQCQDGLSGLNNITIKYEFQE